MAIIATFQNVDNANFNINGRNAPKIFNCIKLTDTRLSIVNVYDNGQVLFSNISFDEIEVDGVVYGNLNDLVTAINPVIFSNSLVENVSQEQLDSIQEIIDSLEDTYAGINHLHEGVYLTEQEIINLIALNPQASDIASAEIVGIQLRFLDAQDSVLFSVNATPFFKQGNLLQYDDVTGKLRLRNQFFDLLSEVTIEPKTFFFDEAEFITGIANDLSNLVIERDFYIVQTLNENIYFVNALQQLNFDEPWRLKFLKNDFEQGLQDADIFESNFSAYELTNFDLTDIEDNEEIKFDFWRITDSGGSFPEAPQNDIGFVRKNANWVNQHVTNTEVISQNHTLQEKDYDLFFQKSTVVVLTLPAPSSVDNREFRLFLETDVRIEINETITSLSGTLIYNSSNDITTPSNEGLSLTIKSINGAYRIVNFNTQS